MKWLCPSKTDMNLIMLEEIEICKLTIEKCKLNLILQTKPDFSIFILRFNFFNAFVWSAKQHFSANVDFLQPFAFSSDYGASPNTSHIEYNPAGRFASHLAAMIAPVA